jgi:competence protein CoiA
MFVADYEGQRICILDYEYPKSVLKPDNLKCSHCGEGLIIKHGEIKEKHFAHYPDSTCQFERLQGEPESLEHFELKRHAGQWARRKFSKATVSYEVRLLDGKRIADVFIKYPSGQCDVIECQMSRISVDEVQARMRDYQSIGYQVHWFFNEALLTDSFVYALERQILLDEYYKVVINEDNE